MQASKWIADGSSVWSLLEIIPQGAMLVDEDGWVLAMNKALKTTPGITDPESADTEKRKGFCYLPVFRMSSNCSDSDGCGKCCRHRLILEALLNNGEVGSNKGARFTDDPVIRLLMDSISAKPVEISGRKLIVLVIEKPHGLFDARPGANACTGMCGMVGRNEKMLALYEMLRDVAPVNVPVLIQGETGTGKELAANAIHNNSPRVSKRFVPVNCAALPHGLLESELFGHVRGAFTGAVSDKKGRFELADGGTIFLDEIGDMCPNLQVKLLRVLQEGCFERLGSTKTVHVDVRVVSATNKDLEAEVAAGRFRSDLYYRLCVVPITLPPLRERMEDVPLLAHHFLKSLTRKLGRKAASLSTDALSMMMRYDWPGNVRELQNAVYFALVRCREGAIRPEHLPPSLAGRARRAVGPARREPKLKADRVAEALDEVKGNRKKAAKILGVSRSTLYRFLDGRHQDEECGVSKLRKREIPEKAGAPELGDI